MGDAPARGLVADSDAQAVRQAVAGNAPHDQPVRLQKGIAGRRLGLIREPRKDEVRGLGI